MLEDFQTKKGKKKTLNISNVSQSNLTIKTHLGMSLVHYLYSGPLIHGTLKHVHVGADVF